MTIPIANCGLDVEQVYFTFLAKMKSVQNVNHAPRRADGIGGSVSAWFVPILGRFVRQTPKTEQKTEPARRRNRADGISPEASSTQARRSVSSLCGFIPCCLNQSFFRAVFVSVLSSPYPTHHIPHTRSHHPPHQTAHQLKQLSDTNRHKSPCKALQATPTQSNIKILPPPQKPVKRP